MFNWKKKSDESFGELTRPYEVPERCVMDDPSGNGATEELTEPVPSDSGEGDEQLHAAQESFRAIESVLQEMEVHEQSQETSFRMPLRDAFMLVPEAYRSDTDMDSVETREISIFVKDFYDQLARGKLAIPLAKFVLDMPPDLVLSAAHQDQETMVLPPLHAVIAAIDPTELAERTASVPVDKGCADQLPDPFGKAELSQESESEIQPVGETPEPEAPELETSEPEVPASDASEPVTPAVEASQVSAAFEVAEESEEREAETVHTSEALLEPAPQTPVLEAESDVAAELPPQSPVTATVPEPDFVPEAPLVVPPVATETPETPELAQEQEEDMPEQFGGLNINTASREQLLTLPGATPSVVHEIIRHRAANGPFRNVFELRHVTLVGRITFRKMTGMPYSQRRHHRVRKMMKLLGLNIQNVHHLPTLVGKLAEQPGFAGCIISDSDGLLLAEQGAADCAEAFSAIVPRMYQQMQDITTEVWPDQVDLLSVCVGDRMFSVVNRGHIYVGAFLSRRKMTKSQLRFIEKVTEELAWLLSHRAYAGPSASWRAEREGSNW